MTLAHPARRHNWAMPSFPAHASWIGRDDGRVLSRDHNGTTD